jgi:hypothetical protein
MFASRYAGIDGSTMRGPAVAPNLSYIQWLVSTQLDDLKHARSFLGTFQSLGTG